MSNQIIIDNLKEQYKTWSDSQLFTLSRKFVSDSDMSIAALQLLDERKQVADKVKEENEVARHHEIQDQLAKLRQPHWSVIPSFWLLIFTVAISFLSLGVAILGLPQVQKFFFPENKPRIENLQQQPIMPKQPEPKPNLPKT
jgi:hypothetical protein